MIACAIVNDVNLMKAVICAAVFFYSIMQRDDACIAWCAATRNAADTDPANIVRIVFGGMNQIASVRDQILRRERNRLANAICVARRNMAFFGNAALDIERKGLCRLIATLHGHAQNQIIRARIQICAAIQNQLVTDDGELIGMITDKSITRRACFTGD